MAELLAPAGSMEALIAAVAAGADAVYLGGKSFGARQYANNFDTAELTKAVEYAHLYRVRVLVTVNTLVDNGELPQLVEYLKSLYRAGVDGIIVQDMGVAEIAKKVVPDMPLHASTQMTVHNLAGVKYLEQYGFRRVVLARELSLKEISYICANSSVEIEIFVHGALCVCYSGQCLMSSMIGGRSGNRGRCAQPCRLPYTLLDSKGNKVLDTADAGDYLLSPKDLNTLELLPEILAAGVASLKIEGRMKRPEYVATVVSAYSQALASCKTDINAYKADLEASNNIAQVFNRGFTPGYLLGKQGHNMMSDRRPNNRGMRIGRVISYKNSEAVIKLDGRLALGDILDFWVKVGGRVNSTITSMKVRGQKVTEALPGEEVTVLVPSPVRAGDRVFKTFDSKIMEQARALFKDSNTGNIPVDIEVMVCLGEPLKVTIIDVDGYTGEGVTDFIAEKALKRPLTDEVIKKQVERIGNTVFTLRNFTTRINGEIMVPISEINEARRRAVEALELARLNVFARPPLKEQTVLTNTVMGKPKQLSPKRVELSISVDTVEKAQAALEAGADCLYFGGERYTHQAYTRAEYEKVIAITRQKGKKVVFTTPRIVKEWQIPNFERELDWFEQLRPDAVSVANIGTFALAKERNLPLHGDFPLNIFNSTTVAFFKNQGLTCLTLSPELTLKQVEDIAQRTDAQLECLIHGYFPLMVSEYCLLGSFLGELHTGLCQKPCLQGKYYLEDRMGEKFPVVTDQYCRMHIFNSKMLSMVPHIAKFSEIGIARIRIEAKILSLEEVKSAVKTYRKLIDGAIGVDEESSNITRGHYFRGVL